jgi:phosphoribosylformylglycinamidine synthase
MPLFLAKITITLRKSILDPQGKAIHHALDSLGMTTVDDVRLGKYFEMKLASADRQEAERITTEACRKLLANSVMEDFAFTVEEA